MERVIVVRGHLANPRRIDLDEAVTELRGAVEVLVRPAPTATPAVARDVFDLIADLAPGKLSKEELDRQLAQDRASWDGR